MPTETKMLTPSSAGVMAHHDAVTMLGWVFDAKGRRYIGYMLCSEDALALGAGAMQYPMAAIPFDGPDTDLRVIIRDAKEIWLFDWYGEKAVEAVSVTGKLTAEHGPLVELMISLDTDNPGSY